MCVRVWVQCVWNSEIYLSLVNTSQNSSFLFNGTMSSRFYHYDIKYIYSSTFTRLVETMHKGRLVVWLVGGLGWVGLGWVVGWLFSWVYLIIVTIFKEKNIAYRWYASSIVDPLNFVVDPDRWATSWSSGFFVILLLLLLIIHIYIKQKNGFLF